MDGQQAEAKTDDRVRRARERMVADQLRRRGIADERVLARDGRGAARAVRRPVDDPRHAYADEALPIEAGQTISQPYMVARMTELLGRRDRAIAILEIGTGSGYQAAILAALGCRVTTIERHPELAASARDRLDDARLRRRRSRSVSATAASAGPTARRGTGSSSPRPRPSSRPPCASSSADGARLVIPVGPRDRQMLTVVTRHGNEWTERAGRRLRLRPARRRGRLRRVTRLAASRPPGRRSVYSAGHDPRLRRAAPGRRRALVRRSDRQPARARSERDDHHGLLRRRRQRRPDALPARGARLRVEGDVAGDRGVQPQRHRGRLADRRRSSRRGRRPRTASRRPRPTPTPPPSGSGSARRGTAGPASATSRSPSSRSSTTCRPRAPSSPTRSSTRRRPAT